MLSTKNLPEGGAVSKTLKPGNVRAHVYDIQLTKGYNEGTYNLQLSLESEPIQGEFEGFYIDKDDPSKGRFAGQVGRVNFSQYAYETKTLPGSNTKVDRDQSILKALKALAKSQGVSEQLDEVTAATIEEYVVKAREVLVNDHYTDFCVAGREYTDKNGYTNYNLFLAKANGRKYGVAASRTDVVDFNEDQHIIKEKKKPAQEVNGFEPGKGAADDFGGF